MSSLRPDRSVDLHLVPFAIPATEADDIDLLHRISVELISESASARLYERIVEAAVAIAGSQFGTMQLLCPKGDPSGHGGELQLLAHRGLPPEAIAFWQWVKPSAYSSCTEALKLGRRAIIRDFEEWNDIAGTPDFSLFAGRESAPRRRHLSCHAAATYLE